MDVCAQFDFGLLCSGSEPWMDVGLLSLSEPPTPDKPFDRLASRDDEEEEDAWWRTGAKPKTAEEQPRRAIAIERFMVMEKLLLLWNADAHSKVS